MIYDLSSTSRDREGADRAVQHGHGFVDFALPVAPACPAEDFIFRDSYFFSACSINAYIASAVSAAKGFFPEILVGHESADLPQCLDVIGCFIRG